MKMIRQCPIVSRYLLPGLVALLTLASSSFVSGQAVRFFGLAKGQQFVQTNAGPAVPDGISNRVFEAFLDQGGQGLTNVQLFLPGGTEVPLSSGNQDDGFKVAFDTQGAIDSAFPNGTYSFVIGTIADGSHTNLLTLAGDAYPATPVLANFGAAQAIDPAANFSINWQPIPGADTNDFVQVSLEDCTGQQILQSASPGEPGGLNGTNTAFVIPARHLRPGARYDLTVMVAHFTTMNTNSQPGATGVAVYLKRTRASVATIGTPTGCPVGRFELVFQYPPFQFGSSTQGVVSFPQGLASAVANLSVDGWLDTNFPPTVTFTGPGGFGWNASTNAAGNTDSSFAWYGSSAINLPPFPPGGVYSINYKGTNLQFNLLNPDAVHQQVLVLPTVVVDTNGLLTDVHWEYRDTNGVVVGPQPYMQSIIVRVESQVGFYDAQNFGPDLSPTNSTHQLIEFIPWATVQRLQVGFRDITGNSFLSMWERVAPGLQITTTSLPNGVVNLDYFATLQSSGGVPPLVWSLDGGSLPGGLSLNSDTGNIVGAPTNAGLASFVIRVTDSLSNTVAREFGLNVRPPGNTPPFVSHIPDQVVPVESTVGPLPFEVGDLESAANTLLLDRFSSNESIVRTTNIVINGSGASRSITLWPEPGVVGTVQIFVTASDGQLTSTNGFVVTFEPDDSGPGTQPNVREIFLIKGQGFVQTNAAAASADGPSNVLFQASVSIHGRSSITNGSLRLPNGSLIPFDPEEKSDEAAIKGKFATVAALDAAFPNGSYAFLLDTANSGTLTNVLSVSGNNYPATPRINNFVAAQVVNPTNDFALSWDSLAGATTNDVIFVEIRDCQDREVFSTPGPGRAGALNGSATSALIPGRTLRLGQDYFVNLIVGRITSSGSTNLPGATVIAGYFKQVSFHLGTIGPGAECPFGEFSLSFSFRPGTLPGTLGSVTYPEEVVSYVAQFRLPPGPKPSSGVTFSGPPGSGLINTGTGASGSGHDGAWFSSYPVNTPPFPPGGPYSVQVGDVTYTHLLLDPRLSIEKVQVVPNVVTNVSGEVTGLNWTYRAADGALVGPQSYMRTVRISIFGSNQVLYPQDFQPDLVPGVTNIAINPPIPWTLVQSIRTGFGDVAGHEVMTDWIRGSANVQILTFALPVGVVSNVYSGGITAFGGASPYAWTITSGNLPSGLQLNADTGVIAGTPLEIGSFPITVRVTDSGLQTADRFLTIRISPPGPDVARYIVGKGRRYWQTNAAPPVGAIPGFQFVSFVEPGILGGVLNAAIQLPGGLVRTLTNDFGRFALEDMFITQSALDASFANGVYTFQITTANEGSSTPSLLLTNNLYPPAPHLLNWTGTGAIDSSADFLVSWDPFVGGTTNDLIVVGVMNPDGDEVFSTPGFLEPNFVDGTKTNAVVPAGTFLPGSPHRGRVLFVKRAGLDTNSYPGVPGVAAYFAETTFDLFTLNPAGVIQFGASAYTVGESAETVAINVVRLGGSQGTVTIDYAVTNGTALGGADFVAQTGTLTFTNGVTNQVITVSILNDLLIEGPETVRLLLGHPQGGAGLGYRSEALLTILDDEAPAGPNVDFYVAVKGQVFVQPGAGLPVPAPATGDAFVFFASTRTAFPGALNSATVKNPSGSTNSLSVREDNRHYEFNASFTNKAALDAAFKSGVYTFRFDTLGDGVVAPTINLPADAYPAAPHLANWTTAQSINAFADFALVWDAFPGGIADDFVQLSIRDTNSMEEVFTSADLMESGALNGLSTSVIIPGGTLQPGHGYAVELLFFNLAVVNTTGYPGAKGLGGYARQTRVQIATTTPPPAQGQLQFDQAVTFVSETNGTAIVNVVRVGGSQGAVSATVIATNGTATSGTDFTGRVGTVALGDGETNATFAITILDDSIYEGPETVRLFLTNPTGGASLAGQTNATVVIVDNELPPTPGSLQFALSGVSVAEAIGSVTLTVTRTGGSVGDVTVDYATSDGSATAGQDYAASSGTLTFAQGVVSRTISIDITPDALHESNEVFVVTLTNPGNGATLGERSAVSVTILDDDLAGSIAFSATDYSVDETAGSATITVRRTGGAAHGVTVDYLAVGGTATENSDFEATAGTIEFGAGEIEKTFIVPIYDDALPEGNETLSLILTNATGGATLGRITNATLTIIDDEVVLQFARATYTNSEAIPQAVLTVVRTGPLTQSVSVNYGTADLTASAGDDYVETFGTLTFGPGVSSRTISIPLINDGLVEDTEAFQVTLQDPTGAQLGDLSSATVNIVDNDVGGVIAFSAPVFTAREGSPVVLISVVRAGGKASGVTVDYATTEGTALDGSDYTGTNGTLTFGDGVTRLTIAIPIADDVLDEEGESFGIHLSNVTGGAVLGSITDATVNIVDNDIAGSIRLGATAYSVSETGAVATITVLRSGGKAGGVTVDYLTADGTATNGVDYTATAGTLTFEANEVSKTFNIPILADGLPDGNKTVLISLTNATGGGRLISPTNATLTIYDDVTSVQFSSATYSVGEAGRSVTLTVVRSGPPGTVTVNFATANGNATSPADYKAKSGVVTFTGSVSTRTIVIPIVNDTVFEGDETFTVTLSNPSVGAQLGARSTTTVTIVDDEVGAPLVRQLRRVR